MIVLGGVTAEVGGVQGQSAADGGHGGAGQQVGGGVQLDDWLDVKH